MSAKKTISRIIAVFLCLSMLFALSAEIAFAATSGGKGSTTINVTTKANYWYPGASSITLKQSKQTLTYRQLTGSKTKTKTGYYGCYDITVYNKTENDSYSVYWGGGQTKKISLDPNCTYRITVRYNSTATALFTSQPFGYSWKSSSSPSWSVSSKWKVSSCY